MLAFIVALSLKEDRDEKWAFAMWFPVVAIAATGTLLFLYGLFLVFSTANTSGPDAGITSVAIIAILAFSSPFLVLLYLCIKYRPRPQAYTLPYVCSTILATLLIVVLLFVLVRFFGMRLRIWA